MYEQTGDLLAQARKGRRAGFGSHEDEDVPFAKILIQFSEGSSGSAFLSISQWLRANGLCGSKSHESIAPRDDQATIRSLKAHAFLENLIEASLAWSN